LSKKLKLYSLIKGYALLVVKSFFWSLLLKNILKKRTEKRERVMKDESSASADERVLRTELCFLSSQESEK